MCVHQTNISPEVHVLQASNYLRRDSCSEYLSKTTATVGSYRSYLTRRYLYLKADCCLGNVRWRKKFTRAQTRKIIKRYRQFLSSGRSHNAEVVMAKNTPWLLWLRLPSAHYGFLREQIVDHSYSMHIPWVQMIRYIASSPPAVRRRLANR